MYITVEFRYEFDIFKHAYMHLMKAHILRNDMSRSRSPFKVRGQYIGQLATTSEQAKKSRITVEVQRTFMRFLVDTIFISELTKTKRAFKNERGGTEKQTLYFI